MDRVAQRGRPAATSRAAVSEVAVELFFTHGYADTTVAMIAERVGISRTSFFRYFSSKAEVIWSDFDEHTDRLGRRLADGGCTRLSDVRTAVVENLRIDLDSGGVSLLRFELLDTAPELRLEESVRWFTWADVVARHLMHLTNGEHPTPMQAATGAAIQATMLAVLREAVRLRLSREALLARLDAELRLVCSAFEPLLDG